MPRGSTGRGAWWCEACGVSHAYRTARHRFEGVEMCERQAAKRFAQARAKVEREREEKLVEEMQVRHPLAFNGLRGQHLKVRRATELWAADWAAGEMA